MRESLVCCILLVLILPVFDVYSNDNPQVWDTESRVYYKFEEKDGYVFFEGFDFENYRSESQGIESMLARTLVLLQQYYKSTGQPFVFVGHSQGGAA